MTAIDILRVVSLVVWLSVAISRTGAVYRVLRGRARYYDILESIISGIGFLIAGFNVRWFLPPSIELHVGLYASSVSLGLALSCVLWRYKSAAK